MKASGIPEEGRGRVAVEKEVDPGGHGGPRFEVGLFYGEFSNIVYRLEHSLEDAGAKISLLNDD